MTVRVKLPTGPGRFSDYVLRDPADLPSTAEPPRMRVAYAAAHVVADSRYACTSAAPGCVDWDATLRQRLRLWELGLGVAEAMDTAQRGMGIQWPDVKRLVAETLSAGREVGGATVVGVATDTMGDEIPTIGRIIDAYLEQLSFVEDLGGTAVIMASRQLAAAAQGPDDYLKVYDAVISQARRPVLLHWLGTDFDPSLTGYWGRVGSTAAMEVVLDLIRMREQRIEGIKISLLDPELEIAIRCSVPDAVKVFTGDDFNYVDLIAGSDGRHSHALLGAFAAIAPIARAALGSLDDGDMADYRNLLGPTLPLSRLIFEAPTWYYKTGIVWLAYLQGHQSHFRMLGGLESGRSVSHLLDVFSEADKLGLFCDPELTAARLSAYLSVNQIV